jgi:hypothetical protein
VLLHCLILKSKFLNKQGLLTMIMAQTLITKSTVDTEIAMMIADLMIDTIADMVTVDAETRKTELVRKKKEEFKKSADERKKQDVVKKTNDNARKREEPTKIANHDHNTLTLRRKKPTTHLKAKTVNRRHSQFISANALNLTATPKTI